MRLSETTPHMKGNNVLRLQKALKLYNYLQGKVDGEYGPDTARAVYRAKYWLGYVRPNKVAGDMLLNYLEGRRALTPIMKKRVMTRSAAAKKKPLRLKMWDEASKWIGTKEYPPDSNKVVFSLWYGLIGPWCAMFVSYCGVKVGSKAFSKGHKYAYVPYIVADARAGRNNLAITYKPQTGDIVCFDWDNDGVADHVGLFGEWKGAGFTTIEGNTGYANASNGGEVLDMKRSKSDVLCFVHVGG